MDTNRDIKVGILKCQMKHVTLFFFFFKSHCKYVRTIWSWESKPAKGDVMEQRLKPTVFLREPWQCSRWNFSQFDCSVIWIWLKSRFSSTVWSHLLHGGETVQQRSVNLCYQTRTKEREPIENRQNTSIFQLVYFHLVFFVWVMVDDTGVVTVGQAGCLSGTWVSSAEALQVKKGQIVVPFHLWPFVSLGPCKR